MLKKLTVFLKCIIYVMLITNFNIYALPLPKQEAVPGGIIRINLNIPIRNDQNPPQAFFQDKKLLVYSDKTYYYALLGLPLELKPGKYNISFIDHTGEKKTKIFTIKDKKYNISKITIKNQNMVTPDPKTQDRIVSDLKKMRQVLNNYSEQQPGKLTFLQPVKGSPTTSFGATRIINGIKKSPHSGMDIAAPTATPVVAAADGIIVLAENFYLSGNVVAIDHGSGLVTMYAHLSKIMAKVGDTVSVGNTIGLVGSTGRVTGPHLHWTVRLNQASVNPDLFIEKLNSKNS